MTPPSRLALRDFLEKCRAELKRIGRINTDEDRPRVIPELTAFMWLNELDALTAANAATWQPTADAINALPEPLRRYIHQLQTRCDPAGDTRELWLTRDENAMLRAKLAQADASVETPAATAAKSTVENR